jgi:hypothetical protein
MKRASSWMRSAFALAYLAAVGCLQIQPEGASDDAGAGPDAPGPSEPASLADAGIGCATDSTLRITLCTGLTACPGIAVDHELYPDCGFRSAAGAIDLLCVCDQTWICPMGVALSCSQAASVLSEGSEAMVCAQIADGRCTDIRATTPPSSSSDASCDETCRASCASDRACLTACGC